MKNIRIRLLAMLLCLVMCFSLLPVSAMAEEGTIAGAGQPGIITAEEEGSISYTAEEEPAQLPETEEKETGNAVRQTGVIESAITTEKEAAMESADVSAYILQEGGLLPTESQLAGGQKKGAKAAENEAYIDMAEALIYAAAVNWDGSDSILVDISEAACPVSDLWMVTSKLINDHPDLFYLTGYYSYSYSDDDTVTQVDMWTDPAFSRQDVEVFRNKADRILAGVDSRWSDEQKSLYLHDYLVTHCEYDLDYSNYDAYDAIVTESSVCQGYALAYCFLLQQSGVECGVVTSGEMCHAWNVVMVGGEHYYVDCTWDDPVVNDQETWYQDYCSHMNFLRSRDGFASIGHDSTDWVDSSGNDVYSSTETGTAYENAWWNDCDTAIPHVGNKWAYFLGSDSGVYLHDYASCKDSRLFTLDGKWYVWGSSSYYTGFSHLAAYGEYFYISTADKIYRFTSDGKREQVYSLTDDELTQGYIYGIRVEGSSLYYRIYTGFRSGDFAAEYALLVGEEIIDIIAAGTWGDNLTWELDENGVLTIRGEGQMLRTESASYGEEYPWYPYRKSVKKIVLTSGITSIASGAFAESAAVSAELPEGLKDIGNAAFFRNEQLRSLTLPGTLETIGWEVFVGTQIRSFHIPASVSGIGEVSFLTWRDDTVITVDPANPLFYTDEDGILWEGTERIIYCPNALKESYTVAPTVREICSYAFCKCRALQSIILPASVESIGSFAFQGPSLKTIQFNGSCPEMGNDPFYQVTATAYYFPEQGWEEEDFQDYGGSLTWEPLELFLNEATASVSIGKTLALKVLRSNGSEIDASWSSSDEEIASVSSSGVVKAKKVGTAVITATADGIVLTCNMRVLFKDVTDPTLFYYDPIYNMVDKGVIGGYDDGTFRPTGNCNRAAVVTFLWRLDGKPEPTKMAAFKDMTGTSDFDKAISWAAEQGITSGWSDNTFRPWNTCNRAAIVTFLWRYAGSPRPRKMATFKDMPGNPDFDKAISWAAENGITTGWDDNTFRPWNTCNRLAVASFLDRYDKLDPSSFAEIVKIGLVTDIGGVHDRSFNQSSWEGLQALAAEDPSFEVNYLESKTDADYQTNINTFIDEDYDLIVGVGFMLADAVRAAAEANPGQKFAVMDDASCADLPNVACLMFAQEQASFLVGLVAGSVTESKTVGYVQGMVAPEMNKYGVGYIAGVLEACPDATVLQYNANNFGDIAGGNAAAKDMIAHGADVIYQAAGGTGMGVINACSEEGIWAIGVDTDQSILAPDHVITSAMKRVDAASQDIAKAVKDGTYTAGVHTYDLSNGGVDLAPTRDHIPAEVLKYVEQTKADVIAGRIIVPTTAAGCPQFILG